MRGTVEFIDMAARGARPRGVAGVNRQHGHTGQPCFVLNKGAQLKERPTMHRGSLAAPNRYPVTNTAQVFQGDAASGVLRRSHDPFADRVVHIFGKAAFFSAEVVQSAPGAFRALALQPGPQAAVTVTHLVHRAAAVGRSIAVRRQVDDAQVNPQEVLHRFGRRFVRFADLMQVEVPASIDQVGFALHRRQQAPLPLPGDKRDRLPPANRPEGDGLRRQAPRQIRLS